MDRLTGTQRQNCGPLCQAVELEVQSIGREDAIRRLLKCRENLVGDERFELPTSSM